MSDNSGGFNGSNFIANISGSMASLGVSASAAAASFSSASSAMNSAFPTAKDALDRVKAMDRALELLRDDAGPPDAIRVLAAERAKEMDVQVSFVRALEAGEVVWTVIVRTKRGMIGKRPYLTEKQKAELATEFFAIEAWKNAMRDAGLL